MIRPTTWHGLPAWMLETADAAVVMAPAMGAKIVSLYDKRCGYEWLARPMAGRPVRPVDYAAPFTEQDMAGWDEMFPTIVACPYPGPGPLGGTPLPDHGEAWCLPWSVAAAEGDEVVLNLTGRALPYRLARSASFVSSDTLSLGYTLESLSDEPMPYIWAAHPQFVAGPGCEIILPPEITEVINTIPPSWGWGAPGTPFTWPAATAPDGRQVRLDRVGPPSLRKARKFFAPASTRPSWVALVRREPRCWLRFEWDPSAIPYLGLWVDEGAINDQAVVAPEPTTGWHDDLSLAWRNREVRIIPAGGVHQWTVTVRLGTDSDPKAS